MQSQSINTGRGLSAHKKLCLPSQKWGKKRKLEEDWKQRFAFTAPTDQTTLWRRGPRIQKRLITIEYVWFPAVQTLIGKTGRQRGDALEPAAKVSLLQSMASGDSAGPAWSLAFPDQVDAGGLLLLLLVSTSDERDF